MTRAWLMVAYPVLSVYPQGVLYRAFFFECHAGLFPGKWVMIVASAAAFAFLHIVFRNSLAPSSVEYALYGCWLFTVGLGQLFYHGTIASVGTVMRR